jgi:hypothetical protein
MSSKLGITRKIIKSFTLVIILTSISAQASLPHKSVTPSLSQMGTQTDENDEIDENENFGTEPIFSDNPQHLRALPSGLTASNSSTPPMNLNGIQVQMMFDEYSNLFEVRNMIDIARQHIADDPDRYIVWVKRKRKTMCYRAVKEALRESGMVSQGFTGGNQAKYAVKDLEKEGFINLLDKPEYNLFLESNPIMAPRGSILVYETVAGQKANKAGHAEIKTADAGQDGYISISETQRPTYGYDIPDVRKLIGVMIKY